LRKAVNQQLRKLRHFLQQSVFKEYTCIYKGQTLKTLLTVIESWCC